VAGHPDDPIAKIEAVLPRRWDSQALRAGALVCLVFAIPFTVLGAVVDGLRVVSFFGALLGFVVGSGCAAWVQRSGTPMSHALVTAGGTYLVAQAVFVTIRLVAGDDVNWFGVFFTLSLVLLAGIIGGFLGNRLQAQGLRPSIVTDDR
jgi:hypothetical protein